MIYFPETAGDLPAVCVELPCQPRAERRSPAQSAPLAAMEARSVDTIPRGGEWQYEPKWDGFRCLLSRDGSHVDLRSKSGEDLTRYFPELVEAALKLKASGVPARRRDRGPARQSVFIRRSAAANSSRREPGQETFARKRRRCISRSICWRPRSIKSFRRSRFANGGRCWSSLRKRNSSRTRPFDCRQHRQAMRPPKNGWRDRAAAATA